MQEVSSTKMHQHQDKRNYPSSSTGPPGELGTSPMGIHGYSLDDYIYSLEARGGDRGENINTGKQ